MDIIDTHAHYDDEWFDEDRNELMASLPSKGVFKVITQGCSVQKSKACRDLADKYDFVYFTAGVHPEDIDSIGENWLSELEKLLSHEKAVAVGEIGLDYHYEGFDRNKQIAVFEQQLILANRLNKPVVIHSRDATKDVLDLLKKHRPKGVMHCFSGSVETAREVLDLGLYISFTGALTFKNAKKAVAACEAIPAERLMLETDSPYMAPHPFRGNRCDSSFIRITAEKMAEIKGLDTDEMVRISNENAATLFGI